MIYNNLETLFNLEYFVIFFTVFTLACYRLVSLFGSEDGPKMVFYHLRVIAGVRMDSNGNKLDDQPRGSLAYLLTCPWCCSVWVTAVVFAIYLVVGTWFMLLIPLAASTVVIKMDKWVNQYLDGKRIEQIELEMSKEKSIDNFWSYVKENGGSKDEQ